MVRQILTMIVISDGAAAALTSVELGGYTPLNMAWERTGFGPPLYWLTGDFPLSRAELGFAEDTGVLVELTLVLVPDLTLVTTDAQTPSVPRAEGLPQCDLSAWIVTSARGTSEWVEARNIVEPGPVVAELGPGTFRVLFAPPGTRWSRILVSGRVRCWITDASELGAVEITALTAQERTSLLEYRQRLHVDRAKGMQGGTLR
jgi:hypothetical protein